MNNGIPTAEVMDFFEAFATAFQNFDGRLIAQRYAERYVALNADGTLLDFSTGAAIAAYFQGHLDRYRQSGCRRCTFADLQCTPLGSQSTLASLTWRLHDADGAVMASWRESYNLHRSDHGLRIYASTDHVA